MDVPATNNTLNCFISALKTTKKKASATKPRQKKNTGIENKTNPSYKLISQTEIIIKS